MFGYWHRVYKWLSAYEDGAICVWAPDIRDESFIVGLLMAVCTADIRTPIPPFLSSADATPNSGGSVVSQVGPGLAKVLYGSCEYKGCSVGLENQLGVLKDDGGQPEVRMVPEDP
eukprot:8450525-Karenia_brevis.AAC.1